MTALEKVGESKPWERIPGETAKAYAAFVCYRDMPTLDRSLRGLAGQLGRGASVIANWSRQHGWVARAEAHDQHLDTVALAAQDAKVKALAELRADVAIEAMVLVVKRIRGDEGDEANGVAPTPALDAGRLDAKDLAALANVGEKIGASLDRAAIERAGEGGRDVTVRVAFDMTPNYGAGVIDVPVHAELPKGDEDA